MAASAQGLATCSGCHRLRSPGFQASRRPKVLLKARADPPGWAEWAQAGLTGSGASRFSALSPPPEHACRAVRLWRGAGWHRIGLDAPPQNHHRPATGAAPDGALRGNIHWRLSGRWPQVQQLQQVQSAAAVVVQEAEVSGALQAFGQDVLQQQPQEVRPRQGAAGGFAALGIAPAVGDQPVLAAQDVALGDHAPVQVAPQVAQRGLPIAHRFAVHHPALGQLGRQGQPGLGQGGLELGREHLGERLVVKEVTPACRLSTARGLAPLRPAQLDLGAPEPVFAGERRRRQTHMHMRMKAQLAVVRVQHRQRAGCARQLGVVQAEGLEGVPGAAHQQLVDHALV